MRLQTFNAGNIAEYNGEPTIRLSGGGEISFNKSMGELAGFEEGSEVSLHQDEDNPADWYVSLGEEGFKLKKDERRCQLFFHSAALCKLMRTSLNVTQSNVGFKVEKTPVVEEEVNYWPIVTATPIIKERPASKKSK